MVQVLPPVDRNPGKTSIGERLAGGIERGVSQGMDVANRMRELAQKATSDEASRKQDEAFQFRKMAEEHKYKDIQNREERTHERELLREKYGLESKMQEGKNKIKKSEEVAPNIARLKGALGRLNEMEALRKKGNLGRFSSIPGIFGGETSKDRGAYRTLGNSLISYTSTIPVRNRQEFETLTGKINDPNITDSEAEGILGSMRRIIQDSLNEYDQEEEDEQPEEKILNREIMSYLYDQANGDEKEVKRLARKMGYKI